MTTNYKSSLLATLALSSNLANGQFVIGASQRSVNLQDGSGLSQAAQVYYEETTLAASGNETIDLALFGGAVDALGSTYDLTKLKGIVIRNLATDPTAILTVEPGTSNPWIGANGSTTVVIALIEPGGEYVLFAPSATGRAISSTSKTIKLLNGSSTAALQYDLVVVGA